MALIARSTNQGLMCRSHREFTTNPWDVELRRLHLLIQNDIEDDVYIFGESMYAIHSIEYTDLESYSIC